MNLQGLLPASIHGLPAPIRSLFTRISGLDSLEHLYGQVGEPGLRGPDFATRVLGALDIRIRLDGPAAVNFPRNTPVIVTANHPFGMLEGLAFAAVFEGLGLPFRFLANEVLGAFEPMRDWIIPVDVFGDPGASRLRNVPGLREALRWLRNGGVLIVFPSGEVSSWQWTEGAIADREWSPGVARLASISGATVVPAFFEGSNSVPFQLLGLVHPSLRTMRLPAELEHKRGSRIRLSLGHPIRAKQLEALAGDPAKATGLLRTRTELLRFRGLPAAGRLVENPPQAPSAPHHSSAVLLQMERLAESARHTVLETGRWRVIRMRAAHGPAVLTELGRLRAEAFRLVGEGPGTPVDLDSFDTAYEHLVLWDAAASRVAGGYRFCLAGHTTRPEDLYTATTFRYGRQFLHKLGHCMELGRSFLTPAYQKDCSALLLLWRAIHAVAGAEGAPVLFGAASISNTYQPFSRALMAHWLRLHAWRPDLAACVKPAYHLGIPLTWRRPLDLAARSLGTIDQLAAAVSDLEPDARPVPVLIRQYLRTGGRVACLGVDPGFGGCLDALVVTDLRQIPAARRRKLFGYCD